jgi:hypothetical protein
MRSAFRDPIGGPRKISSADYGDIMCTGFLSLYPFALSAILFKYKHKNGGDEWIAALRNVWAVPNKFYKYVYVDVYGGVHGKKNDRASER